MAIELANNPQKIMSIKMNLSNCRLSSSLFNTPLFAKNIESAYIEMYARYQADLQPAQIFVTQNDLV